jgi:hypothetical protein
MGCWTRSVRSSEGSSVAASTGRGLAGAAIAALLLLVPPTAIPASAQRPQPVHASVTLPAEHWAVEAARRAEALGLTHSFVPARRSVPRHVVAAALRDAVATAERERAELVPLTRGWLTRLESELPELTAAAGGPHLQGGRAYGRAMGERGRARPWRTYDGIQGGAPLPEDSGVRFGAVLAAGASPHLAAMLQPEAGSGGAELARGELVAGVRGVTLSLARTPVGYGYGGEGVVLAGRGAFDLIQLETPEPFRLPGALRHAGRFGVHAFLSRIREGRHPGDPYFYGIAGVWQPHPRASISILRGSMLGGDSIDTPVTVRNVARSFIGHNLLEFENEVVSGLFRYRLPSERWLPLTAYLEWGAEDAAGAWRDVPGRIFGVLVPAVPGAPALAIGAEYAAFGGSCCGNGPWYWHAWHPGGWVLEDRMLGHSLGGHGREVLGYTQVDLAPVDLRIVGRGFRRERLEENLFWPARAGQSSGASVQLQWRPTRSLELELSGSGEWGSGWSERVLGITASALF